MERGILEEVKDFLEYIGEKHKEPKKKSWENLERRFGKRIYERVYDLCFHSGYIKNFPHGKGENRYCEVILDSKGLNFLEEQRRWKLQQNQTNSQNFLTFGILTFAIFSGMITFVYYYFDLRTRHIPFANEALVLTALILLVIISIGIIKLRPEME